MMISTTKVNDMAGGRGTLLDIASALNEPKHKKIAKAIKMAINDGYRVSGVSVQIISASYAKCKNPKELTSVWCHALERQAVDYAEY